MAYNYCNKCIKSSILCNVCRQKILRKLRDYHLTTSIRDSIIKILRLESM